MTTHAPEDVELALLRWIDRGVGFQEEASRWSLETRRLRYAASHKWALDSRQAVAGGRVRTRA